MASPTLTDTDKRDLIRAAAFSLMMEKGFSRTSYTDIARASDCTRALVQYYFPKKDQLMVDFMQRALELGEQYACDHGLKTGSCFIDFYTTGYIHFSFLLRNAELLPLTRDMIATRDHSAVAIAEMTAWQRRYPELDGLDDETITDAVLLSVGGAYELIHHHLKQGRAIDIPRLLERTIHTFIVDLGLDPSEFAERHSQHLLDEETLACANAYLRAHIIA